MAKVLTDSQNYTNIADNIRSITGSEALLKPAEMTGELTSVKQEIDEQAELIEQIQETLEGKAAGGSNIETCSLSTGSKHTMPIGFAVTTFENNTVNVKHVSCSTPNTLISDKVIKNSLADLVLRYNNNEVEMTNIELLNPDEATSGAKYKILGDATFSYWMCFVKDTLILLADGTTKKVQNVKYDDTLLVWDFDNGCFAKAKPIWIKQKEVADYYYKCEFEDGTTLNLVGSNGECHSVFSVDDNCFIHATDCVGKNIASRNGIVKLVSCKRIDTEVEYYNIITNYHLNLYAGDILTSAGYLNNLYKIENMKFVKEDREIIPFEDYKNISKELYYGLRLGEMKKEKLEATNAYVCNMISKMNPIDNGGDIK